eukprot:453014-Amphidinium_carterae.1
MPCLQGRMRWSNGGTTGCAASGRHTCLPTRKDTCRWHTGTPFSPWESNNKVAPLKPLARLLPVHSSRGVASRYHLCVEATRCKTFTMASVKQTQRSNLFLGASQGADDAPRPHGTKGQARQPRYPRQEHCIGRGMSPDTRV